MNIRELERASIKAFLRREAERFAAGSRVLDFGCGRAPYRELIEELGGMWAGYDLSSHRGSVVDDDVGSPELLELFEGFDVIVCTQVVQYLVDPEDELARLRPLLAYGGALLATGPTNWPVIEDDDLWRWTAKGAALMLTSAGFSMAETGFRAAFDYGGEAFPLGWWAVAEG